MFGSCCRICYLGFQRRALQGGILLASTWHRVVSSCKCSDRVGTNTGNNSNTNTNTNANANKNTNTKSKTKTNTTSTSRRMFGAADLSCWMHETNGLFSWGGMRWLLWNGQAPLMHPPEASMTMVSPFAGDKTDTPTSKSYWRIGAHGRCMEHINFHEVNDNASKDDYTYIAHSYISSEDASEKDYPSGTLTKI